MSDEDNIFPISVSTKKWDLRVVIQVVLKKHKYSFEEMKEIKKSIREGVRKISMNPEVTMTSHSCSM